MPYWVRAWLVAGVVFAAALTTPSVSLPADAAGFRRFQVELDQTTTVSQTFVMTADGLAAVTLSAAATHPDPTGSVQVDLFDVSDRKLVHKFDVSAREFVEQPVYRLTFPPIDDSAGQTYRIDVRGSNLPAGGIALWATKGSRYSGGTMLINDRERWADLTFAAYAPAGQTAWTRLTAAATDPRRRSGAQAALGALAAYLAALGFLLRVVASA